MSRPTKHPATEQQTRALRRVRRLSRLMDASVRIPGTRITFGLDPLIGLIPGAGDLLTLAIAAYPLYEAHRNQLPARTKARMIANLLLDTAVGAIPLAGDLFDFFYKANLRNLRLFENALEKQLANEA